ILKIIIMKIKKLSIIIILSIPILLVGVFKFSESRSIVSNPNIYSSEINENIIYQNIKKEYGITLDSFNIITKRIRRNENLADILSSYIDNNKLNKLISESGKVFDLRHIKAGNNYKIYFTKDSVKSISYFVYQHSPIEYLKFDLSDKSNVFYGKKKIVNTRKTCKGIIKSSLWNTMLENDLNPILANRLADIYAWSIDFFDLKKDDSFKVIYNERSVDSISIGIDEIFVACFTHKGDDYYAFEFMQDSIYSYYDRYGNSLRKQFLKAPLKFFRISSKFSRRRYHPILKIYRPHSGVDYAAPRGTPIYAIGEGVISRKGRTKGAGNYLRIKHNGIYSSGYNHISRYAKGIRKGNKVNQGDVIAYVGSTGYATGPHLDFRFYKNGRAVNPLKVKSPPVKPIKEKKLEEFEKEKLKDMKELKNI
ncbi:MAG: peptidoglycan DD-metalloendopeptidase family protein, partial [Bacteroidales bacterium]|nr:peptidoglycan DD-metalloendopeptidase family protein [Bacteroidales bacterium]